MESVKEAKREPVKTEEVEKPKNEILVGETLPSREAVDEGVLPQRGSLEEPEEAEEAETDIIETVEGRVTNIDPYCTGMVTVNGVAFDAGSLDLTTVRIGDVVEVTYTKKKYGSRDVNVLESVGVFGSSQQSTRKEASPEEELSAAPQEAVEREEPPPEKKPLEEPEEAEIGVPKTIQGRVTDYEFCTDAVTVNGINFQPGSVDLTGIQVGDFVEVTYTQNKYGKVLESAVVIESRH